MDPELIARAFDLALLRGASEVDLGSAEARQETARRLAGLFEALVVRAVRPEATLELGAHAARFSRAIKSALPQTIVHAVEANPYAHARFQRQAQAAGVAYHHLAVGDETRDAVFKVAVRRDGEELSPTKGSNSLRTKPLQVDYEDAAVRMVTVDQLAAELGLAGRSLALWIDVEGCAYEVLCGARQTLEQTLLLMVEVEDKAFWTGQKTAPEVKRLLFASGFIPIARDFEFKSQYNLIYLKPELLDRHAVRQVLELSFAGLPAKADP